MKKSVIVSSIVLILGFSGCVGSGNSSALLGTKIANESLAKKDAPIRYKAIELKNGVSHEPYLVGKIAPSVASQLLKKDTLNLIMQKEETRNIELVQTRYVSHSSNPTTYKEVWVVRIKSDNSLHGHTVRFTDSPRGGVDILLLHSSRVFEAMLQI